ncbi:MAG: hypothetical protein HY332_16640 [Chloroflexi bacterium]|nr:hypothetical protein [Chloroflexota bacterium]
MSDRGAEPKQGVLERTRRLIALDGRFGQRKGSDAPADAELPTDRARAEDDEKPVSGDASMDRASQRGAVADETTPMASAAPAVAPTRDRAHLRVIEGGLTTRPPRSPERRAERRARFRVILGTRPADVPGTAPNAGGRRGLAERAE